MLNLFRQWRNLRACGCKDIWCELDALFACRWKYACDRHDKRILGE